MESQIRSYSDCVGAAEKHATISTVAIRSAILSYRKLYGNTTPRHSYAAPRHTPALHIPQRRTTHHALRTTVQSLYHSTTTPLPQRYNSFTLPLQYHCDTVVTPLGHHDITTTPPQYHTLCLQFLPKSRKTTSNPLLCVACALDFPANCDSDPVIK